MAKYLIIPGIGVGLYFLYQGLVTLGPVLSKLLGG